MVEARQLGGRRAFIVVLAVAGLLLAFVVAEEAWRLAGRSARRSAGAAPSVTARRSEPGQSASSSEPSPTVSATVGPSTGGSQGGRPSAKAAPAGSPASAPASANPGGSRAPFGPGFYRVGVDIAPGTWETGGALNLKLRPCSYSINGTPPVETTISVGRIRVTLHAGDTFNTSGCQDWELA